MRRPIDPGGRRGQIRVMDRFVIRDRTIDMTPDGQFRGPVPEGPLGPSLGTQLLRIAVVVAVLAGALAFAALAFWIAMLLIPVALGAALLGWAIFRFRVWQAGRSFRRPGEWS